MELSINQKHIAEFVYPKINVNLFESIEKNSTTETMFLDILLYTIPLVETLKIKKKFWSKKIKGDDKEMIVIAIGDRLLRESINKNYCNDFIKFAKRNIKKIVNSFNLITKK